MPTNRNDDHISEMQLAALMRRFAATFEPMIEARFMPVIAQQVCSPRPRLARDESQEF
jgi:hypothetical protein